MSELRPIARTVGKLMFEMPEPMPQRMRPRIPREQILECMMEYGAPRRQVMWGFSPLVEDGQWGVKLVMAKEKLGSGFLFGMCGLRGPGKTQFGVELMRDNLVRRNKKSRYCTAIEFFIDLKSTYRKESARSEADVMDEYRKTPLLIVDEVGKRGETAWENTLLFELIDRRYRDMTDTLLISNEAQAEFEQNIGDSLSSRMNETGGMIVCTDWKVFR